MGAEDHGQMFVAPLVVDLNGAKRVLTAKEFGSGRSVALWGPGLEGHLRGISHHEQTIRLALRPEHPWDGLPDADGERVDQVVRGVDGQVRALVHTGSVQIERQVGEAQVILRWGEWEDPPVASLGIQMVACALAVVRREGAVIPPTPSAGPRTESLADAFARRRGG